MNELELQCAVAYMKSHYDALLDKGEIDNGTTFYEWLKDECDDNAVTHYTLIDDDADASIDEQVRELIKLID